MPFKPTLVKHCATSIVCAFLLEALSSSPAHPCQTGETFAQPWKSPHRRFSAHVAQLDDGRGVIRLYRKLGWLPWYRQVEKFLLPDGAPSEVVLGDDGKFFVGLYVHPRRTAGVVSIYRSDGSLVRSVPQWEIHTQEDADSFAAPASGPRVWWTAATIQPADETIRIELTPCSFSGCVDPASEITIRLVDGRVLTPLATRLPRWRGSVRWADAIPEADATSAQWVGCEKPDPQARRAALQDLRPIPSGLTLPEFTLAAERARISGTVVLDLQINALGVVECVGIVRPLPMGLTERSMRAARSWRFVGDQEGERPVVVRVALDHSMELVLPEGSRLRTVRHVHPSLGSS
jgi:hypothetical protein